MNELIDVLNAVDNYLKTKSDSSLNKAFSYYDDHILQLDEDFFREKIDLYSNDDFSKVVNKILESLDIPDEQKGRYTDLTVGDFFKELSLRKDIISQINKEKLAKVLEILNQKVKIRWQNASLFGLFSLLGIETVGGLAGASYVTQVLTASAFVPGVGVLIALADAIYNLSPFKIEKKAALLDRVRDSFFVLSKTALKLTASGLALAAAAINSPVISILTVVAAGIGVVHEGFKLLQMKLQGKKRAQQDGVETLQTKQQDVRFENEYQKKARSLWIDLAAAVVTVGIVAAWVFVPGGLLVGLGALAAIGVTYFFQWKAQKSNDVTMKERLETKFNAIEAEEREKTKGLEVSPTNNASLYKSLSESPKDELVAAKVSEIQQENTSEPLPTIESSSTVDLSVTLSKSSLKEAVSSDVETDKKEILGKSH